MKTIKSHKRIRKNGATVVRSHVRSGGTKHLKGITKLVKKKNELGQAAVDNAKAGNRNDRTKHNAYTKFRNDTKKVLPRKKKKAFNNKITRRK